MVQSIQNINQSRTSNGCPIDREKISIDGKTRRRCQRIFRRKVRDRQRRLAIDQREFSRQVSYPSPRNQ